MERKIREPRSKPVKIECCAGAFQFDDKLVCDAKFESREGLFNHLFCSHLDSLCKSVRSTFEFSYSHLGAGASAYRTSQSHVSSFKPVMPYYLDFFDTIVRGFLKSCGDNDSTIYFNIEGFRHLEKVGNARGKLGTMIGKEGLSDYEALWLMSKADLVLIPLQQDSEFGGHMSLITIRNGKVSNYCSSAGDPSASWNILVGVFGEAARSQIQRNYMEKLREVKNMVKTDTQSGAISLEFACGLVTMFLIGRIRYSTFVDGPRGEAVLVAAADHYMDWYRSLRRAEKDGRPIIPKRMMKDFLRGCGLRFLSFQWNVKDYPKIAEEIGEWANSPVEKVEKCIEYCGFRCYYVKHQNFSRAFNTHMPENCVPETKIAEFWAKKKTKR